MERNQTDDKQRQRNNGSMIGKLTESNELHIEEIIHIHKPIYFVDATVFLKLLVT